MTAWSPKPTSSMVRFNSRVYGCPRPVLQRGSVSAKEFWRGLALLFATAFTALLWLVITSPGLVS